MGHSRGKKVVFGVMEQVKGKLLKDFYDSLKKTEASAHALHAPFGEHHRMEIMLGFAQGCLGAAAEVMKVAGISYLHYLAMCACTGAENRILSQSEDGLHSLFHKLMAMFPRGDMPDDGVVIEAGGPLELIQLLNNLKEMADHKPIRPEDLN